MRGFILALVLVGMIFGTSVQGAEDSGGRRYGDYLEAGFPFVVSTVDLRKLGKEYAQNNLVSRGVVMTLGEGMYGCFDTDLLRMACVWEGDHIEPLSMGPLTYNVDNQFGKSPGGIGALPGIDGDAIGVTGIYPGWLIGEAKIEDPRAAAPNPEEPNRGPVDAGLGRYTGIYVANDKMALSYTVGGVDVMETSRAVVSEGMKAVGRTIEVERHGEVFRMIIAEAPKGGQLVLSGGIAKLRLKGDGENARMFGVKDLKGELRIEEGRYLVAVVDAAEVTREFTVYQGLMKNGEARTFGKLMAGDKGRVGAIGRVTKRGGRRHWEGEVVVAGVLSKEKKAYVLDEIGLPNPNPWKRNVRSSGIDFYEDGRIVMVTFDGDVWIGSGIDAGLKAIRWTRFASGLCEPQSVKVVDGAVYVFGRGGITRLHDVNKNGEADFYENFSNLMIQTAETRDFAMDMVARPGGGFYVCKGGQQADSRGIHNGSVVGISADGRRATLVADGLREPYLGIHPVTGVLSASDQQGHYVPSTPVHVVREGDYFGHEVTTWRKPVPEIREPLMWIPHHVNSSGSGMFWVTGGKMGELEGTMLYLSYFVTGVFRVSADFDAEREQGAVTRLPVDPKFPLLKGAMNGADGQAYVTGFQMWGGRANEMAGISRIRYTGLTDRQTASARSVKDGIVLRFGERLDLAGGPRVEDFRVERWNYVRASSYGSGHYKLDGSAGQDRVGVAGVYVSDDGYSVFVHVPDMQEAMQMSLHYRMEAARGDAYEDAVYFTVHSLKDENLAEVFGDIDLAKEAAVVEAEGEATVSIELGKQVYGLFGCVSCHSVDGTQVGKPGPTWKGLFGTEREFDNGKKAKVTKAYLAESIVNPKKVIVKGFLPAMPPYKGILSKAQVESLVMYIESLK